MTPAAVTAVGPLVTNGAQATIDMSAPYVVRVRIVGVADFLFHRWNVEAVDDKGAAAKGSKAKKTDDLESYVYRRQAQGQRTRDSWRIPAQAIIHAAKFRQDPRSPRKSAMDLLRPASCCLTPLASLGARDLGLRVPARVMMQRNGITRVSAGDDERMVGHGGAAGQPARSTSRPMRCRTCS